MLVTVCVAWCAPARAQPPVDHWTPSLAVALRAQTGDEARVDAAFDLRLDGLFGDPTRVRGGGFVDGRVATSGELSAALGATLATHLTGHDGGTTLMLSAGAAAHDRRGLTPAALGRVWWGFRTTVDTTSRYEVAVGLWAEARYLPRDGAVDVLLGVSVDPYALVLPFRYMAAVFAGR